MGKYVVRQTPKPMPSADRVDAFNKGLSKPFLVAGCRGTVSSQNRHPDFNIHAKPRFSKGSLNNLKGKRLVILVHGYNNTTDEALRSSTAFFSRLAPALARNNQSLSQYVFLCFTWPGDTGGVYFNDAQSFAHVSGVALYELITTAGAKSVSLVTHSLGAHVALRALSILGERFYREKSKIRVDHTLLLGAAIEDDVFARPERAEEYHFPESAFGVRRLHIGASRADDVLGGAFRINEGDAALGFSGPDSMEPLASLSRRVKEVSGGSESFQFELHDFSPSSATILNPDLHVHKHGGYWANDNQLNYYVNLLA